MRKFSVVPFLLLVAGVLIAFHPTLLSGFALYQPSPADPRFVNYILEHTWHWLLGSENHREFWNLPIFYPLQNVTAYSDTFLGAAPFFWVWRLLGFGEITAYQLWLIALSVLNFLTAYWFLKKVFPLQTMGASVGAFLFAFGFPRIVQLAHPQLLPHFYTLIAIFSIDRLFHSDRPKPGWVLLFTLSCVLQLYAGYYLGWFFGLALAASLIVSLIVPSFRNMLLPVLDRNKWMILLGAAIGAALLYPLASRHLEAAYLVGGRDFEEVYPMLIYPDSWYYLGADSWLYSWQDGVGTFRLLEARHEQRLGVGLATLILAAVGLIHYRNDLKVRFLLVVSILLALLAMRWPATEFTLWKWIFHYFPGADAIRGVSRIGILFLIPLGAGVGLAIQKVSTQFGRRWAIPLLAIVVLEQGITTESSSKQEHYDAVQKVSGQIDPENCDAFLYFPDEEVASAWMWNLDAMWAGMKTGVPTINGYTSNFPEGWPFMEPYVHTQGPQVVGQALQDWIQLHNLEDKDIRWIRKTSRSKH